MSARPSFVPFVTDRHRADHLCCYGNPVVRTPHIDAIAGRGGGAFAVVRDHGPVHDHAAGSVARGNRPRVGSGDMEHTDDAGPEFSRIVNLNDLGEDEMPLDLRASAGECAALARRFGLGAIAGLRASGGLGRSDGDRVRLRVMLEAEVTQTCVVTLDPVVNRIAEELDILFAPERRASAAIDIAFDPASDREPLTGDSLDLGEVIAEELAVSLDPYPRRSGVAVEIGPGGSGGRDQEPPPGGPFEALAALRRKD